MKEVRKRSFKKKALVLSICLCIGVTLSAQFTLVKPQIEDGLTKPQKLSLLIKSPGIVLEKFGSKEYYMPSLGQFCIWEEKLTKTANRPIKIRLGDQDSVDKLENKSN